MVATVTMNEGIVSKADSEPFTAPRTSPVPMAASTDTNGDAPCSNANAQTVPTSAMVAPTDRSISPSNSTYVMPKPSMAMIETCITTFTRLLTDMKLGDNAQKNPHSTISPTTIPP